jgi:hypothetical protein
MKRHLAAVVAAASVSAAAFATTASAAIFFEPFDYGAGNLGLNVNPSVNQTWYSSATSGTDDRVQVVAGSLSAPAGLPASTGNTSSFGGDGRTDRISMGLGNITSGSVFYSLLLNVSNLTGTAAGGATVFGFNNTVQTALNHDTAGQPTAIAGRLIIRPLASDPTNRYEIGIHKSAGTTGQFVFAPGDFGLSDTIFLVGRYTYNTGGTTDDTFDLWVNPAGSTFGDDSLMPAPTITETAGTDTGTIATLLLRQTTAIVPATMQIDELRADTAWHRVTSNLVPEPASLGGVAGMVTVMVVRRRRRRRRSVTH